MGWPGLCSASLTRGLKGGSGRGGERHWGGVV